VTRRQSDRTEQVLAATLTLARRDGNGVRMRDVSELSGVALGTIYRYFESREYLVYAATQRWLVETAGRALSRSRSGSTVEVCVEELRSAQREYAREPLLLEAWVRARISGDPAIVAAELAVAGEVAGGYVGTTWPPLDHLDPTFRDILLVSAEQVWYAGVVQWVSGLKQLDEVTADIERLVRFLFAAQAAQAAGGSRRHGDSAAGVDTPF
jgi:TetR/AcrR family transcriptional regulator, cholesterol catabolism regulator